MEEKRVEPESRQELNPDQMEQVNGGAFSPKKTKVACQYCPNRFFIGAGATTAKCPICGKENTFKG